MRTIIATKAKQEPKRVVFPEGDSHEGRRGLPGSSSRRASPSRSSSAIPRIIKAKAEKAGLDLKAGRDHRPHDRRPTSRPSPKELYSLRARKGYTPKKVEYYVKRPIHQAMLMLRLGMADGMVAGIERSYPETLEFVLPLVELKEGVTPRRGHARHRSWRGRSSSSPTPP